MAPAAQPLPRGRHFRWTAAGRDLEAGCSRPSGNADRPLCEEAAEASGEATGVGAGAGKRFIFLFAALACFSQFR